VYEALGRAKFSEMAAETVRIAASQRAKVGSADRRPRAEALLWLAHTMLPTRKKRGGIDGAGDGEDSGGAELKASMGGDGGGRTVAADIRLTIDAGKRLRFGEVALAVELADYSAAHDSVGYVATQRPHNIPLWNLYYSILLRLGTQQFEALRRPLIKLLLLHPDSLPLMMLAGHHCAANRDIGLALAEYLQAYQMAPGDPLISLVIGAAYLTLVMQKNTRNRHQVWQGGFLIGHRER
jgi:hypothetical protein